MTSTERILNIVVPLVFSHRRLNLGLLVIVTLFLGWHAAQIQVDAGFEKSIPKNHPYMETFKQYQEAFGGADLISIALIQKEGDIYNERFLGKLKAVTDEVFFLPGVDRSRVSSLFTPGIRYLEITEDGISGGDVMPPNYQPSEQMFDRIRSNVAKAGIIGRIVSEDQRGAMIVAELLEYHPVTRERLDYRQVASELERIRQQYQDDDIQIHVIGFAKIIGDVTDANLEVISFFAITLLITMLMLWVYCGSFKLSLLPLGSALVAVVWEFGLLRLMGFGLDPFAILVPFLVLSIGVSHGVQMVNAWAGEVVENRLSRHDAAVASFRRLAIPGTLALLTDVIGFATIYIIDIEIIREMAINASLGMAAIIITNKVMAPILLSYTELGNVDDFYKLQTARTRLGDKLWQLLSRCATKKVAASILVVCAGLLTWSLWNYQYLKIGEFKQGVPELRPDGRYNQDSAAIVSNFSIGVDVLKVIAETESEACVRYEVMEVIDRFAWHMQNLPNVRSVMSLPQLAKLVSAGWNEGSLKWRILPRNQFSMVQAINPVPSSFGLQNADCSAMPILIFTADHKAETISSVIDTAKRFSRENADAPVHFALASGNLGVMAATNEVVKAQEKRIVLWVYVAIIIFVLLSFRSLIGVFVIVLPLALTSLLTYAFMAKIGVGLKVATLPVVALGAGIGIDDGIYLFSVMGQKLKEGWPLRKAWFRTLQTTGKACIFTSVALSVSVSTWLLSGLQFQADMGVLLLFMFVVNLFGAVIVLPALAYFLIPEAQRTD